MVSANGQAARPWLLRGGAFVAFAATLVFGAATVAQTDGPTRRLQDIQVQALPGNEVELRLVMSESAPEPLAFTIDEPARIALDLADTGISLSSRRQQVNLGVLDTILAAEANGRTRVVLNLDALVAYETRVSGNSVYLTLGSSRKSAGSAAFDGPAPPRAADRPPRRSRTDRRIAGVDFRRSELGSGRVIVELSDPGTPVDVRRDGGSVVVNFEGASLPADLAKRLDVIDFATPVNTVDTMGVGGDTRVIIAATGQFEQLAYQSDSTFTIEIQPVAREEEEEQPGLFSEEREYSGERLTLNFQDIETRAVLQLLADISARNIVVSDTVQGNVTLRLQNVPWDQALDIVLATKGLDMRENGNVIIVAPAEEIAAREKADLESRKEIRELEPLDCR
jgi:type IV pilus assembly protein PilQ